MLTAGCGASRPQSELSSPQWWIDKAMGEAEQIKFPPNTKDEYEGHWIWVRIADLRARCGDIEGAKAMLPRLRRPVTGFLIWDAIAKSQAKNGQRDKAAASLKKAVDLLTQEQNYRTDARRRQLWLVIKEQEAVGDMKGAAETRKMLASIPIIDEYGMDTFGYEEFQIMASTGDPAGARKWVHDMEAGTYEKHPSRHPPRNIMTKEQESKEVKDLLTAGYMELAGMELEFGNKSEALRLVHQALKGSETKLEPNTVDYEIEVVRTLFECGEVEEARKLARGCATFADKQEDLSYRLLVLCKIAECEYTIGDKVAVAETVAKAKDICKRIDREKNGDLVYVADDHLQLAQYLARVGFSENVMEHIRVARALLTAGDDKNYVAFDWPTIAYYTALLGKPAELKSILDNRKSNRIRFDICSRVAAGLLDRADPTNGK
jgi:tetratricopeptide (TPR) repeat protein